LVLATVAIYEFLFQFQRSGLLVIFIWGRVRNFFKETRTWREAKTTALIPEANNYLWLKGSFGNQNWEEGKTEVIFGAQF
jgi:hypothetical protein